MEDLTGRQFGHYQIVAPLGEGGMAAVYKAYQPAMERHVAIKVLPRHMSSSEEFVARFRREAKMLAKLQHPHILSVFDYGEEDGYPYIVMPFVQSGTLSEALSKHHLTFAEINTIISQIGGALAYAHTHGMIHRDVKPSNVLIDESGNSLLTDFGLARMTETSVKITTSGAVMGTPAYMSPEQGTGENIDHRSDIYSLGVILYEMLTGRVPYTAETPIAVVIKHIQDPLPSARKLNPDVPESVELVLLKALAKNPDDRYQNADDLVHALQTAISDMAEDANALTRPPIVKTQRTLPKPFSKTRLTKQPEQKPDTMKFIIGGGIVVLALVGILAARMLGAASQKQEAAATIAANPLITNPVTETVLPPIAETSTESPTATPSDTATPLGPEPVIVDPKGATMILVPAGEFNMGNSIEQPLAECIKLFPNDYATQCKKEYYTDEAPAHIVFLDSFYIDKYEVTNLLYKACVDAGICKAPLQSGSESHSPYYGNAEYNDYPVIWVDWIMAQTYCGWRGARLPSEAEWEKTARGTSTQIYPWGNSFEDSKANSCDANCPKAIAVKNFNDGFAEVAPVTAFSGGANSYGVLNLSGNVSEWVADWYSESYYSSIGDNSTNPSGPQIGDRHVIRGGSWARYPINLRLATRSKNKPEFSGNDLGFRCVFPVP